MTGGSCNFGAVSLSTLTPGTNMLLLSTLISISVLPSSVQLPVQYKQQRDGFTRPSVSPKPITVTQAGLSGADLSQDFKLANC